MTNKERYQNMENEIHVPSEALGKVMSMKKENFKKKSVVKFAVSAAAAFAAVFVVSNGICYAATGNTWVEKATVYVNGEAKEVDIHYTKDENGTTGTMKLDVEESDGTNIEIAYEMDTEAAEELDGSVLVDSVVETSGSDGDTNVTWSTEVGTTNSSVDDTEEPTEEPKAE